MVTIPFSPADPRPERRDAAEHRQQVLEAATHLFTERGVQAVTMDEIAQAAGVGKGTLYRRFADKGQLVMALMGGCVGTLQVDLVHTCADGSPLDRLEAMLAHLVGWIEAHSAELSVIADQAAGERRSARYRSQLYVGMHAMLVDLLEQAVAGGEATIADCSYVADALLAALDVDLYLFQRHERGYPPAQIIDGLHTLVESLRRRSPGTVEAQLAQRIPNAPGKSKGSSPRSPECPDS